jgi:hypothetical protein
MAGTLPTLLSLSVSETKALRFSSSNNQDIPWMRKLNSEGGNSPGSQGPRRNRNLLNAVLVVLLILCIIGGFFGLALYRAQSITNPSNEQISSVAQSKISCQELIDHAMQASDNSCKQIGSNQVCYGNNTLLADLIAGAANRFNQRGDVINVSDLKRLAASPLNLSNNEWGIAIFKVLANLPRSLPGETVTMVVYGNTTLDNPSSGLQTFYFFSNLGQIECEQVPFDGLMITMPSGAGVHFIINGAEMTLMGDASLKAAKNGAMEVSLLSGSGLISANGQSQLVTAGQQTSLTLGGPDGTSAVSPPSPPLPLTPAELALACTLTGQFCSQQQITPVSISDSLATLQAGLGVGPTNTVAETSLPGSTATALPSLTLLPGQTSIKTPTSPGALTSTPLAATAIGSSPTNTFLPSTVTATSIIPTSIFTATQTPPPAATNTPPQPTATNPPPTATNPPPTATNPPPTATNPPPTNTPQPVYVTLCHMTGNGTYNQITVQVNAQGKTGHENHANDIIPAPAGGCP